MPGFLSWTTPGKGKRGPSTIAETLKKLGILDLPPKKDILSMRPKRVRKLFGYKNGSTKVSIFLLNVIWQFYRQIQVGILPEFYIKHGYIRGMWYYLNPRVERYKGMRGDHYGVMAAALTRLVKRGLCTYTDFNFRDRDEATYSVGEYNSHIILVCEKDGMVTVIDDLRHRYGCTTITTGGEPSYMSVNFLVGNMLKAGVDPTQTFVCFSIVDFDPTGYSIAKNFIHQLKLCGLKSFHTFQQFGEPHERLDLVRPDNLSPAAVKRGTYTLKRKVQRKPSTAAWVKLTGGIGGSLKKGLHADEFTAAIIHELVAKEITPHLRVSADSVRRWRLTTSIAAATEKFLVYRMTHPGPWSSPGHGPGGR